MRKPEPRKKERYRFFVSSETDARKKPLSFSFSRGTIVFIFALAALLLLFLCGAAVAGIIANLRHMGQITDLERRIDDQSDMLEKTKKELEGLKLTPDIGAEMQTASKPQK